VSQACLLRAIPLDRHSVTSAAAAQSASACHRLALEAGQLISVDRCREATPHRVDKLEEREVHLRELGIAADCLCDDSRGVIAIK